MTCASALRGGALERPRRGLGLRSAAWSIGLVGAWIATGALPDIRFAMVAGVILVAMTIVTLREVRRSKAINDRMRGTSTALLCMMLLAPFARLLLASSAH